MRALIGVVVGSLVSSGGCTRSHERDPTGARVEVPSAPAVDAAAEPVHAVVPPEKSPQATFAAWLRARVPSGATVDDAAPSVIHTVAAGDTALSIAKAYLDLTDVYAASDLAAIVGKENPVLAPGSKVKIPHLLLEPYKDGEHDRLGWPKDQALRAVFITGAYAGIRWIDTLDKVAARNMNAVVLDGKDYMGPITYPTKVKVAIETEAGAKPSIPDLARAIRFAHARGVRVIMRIACFHDPWAQKRAPRLSIMGNWGKPFPMGWLDPTNVEAQDYILDLAKEQMDAGADEIQLDYVRFPVHGGLKSAVMPPGHGGERTKAIRDFVRRVHEVTKPRGVALSLDIFGVTTAGDRGDIEMLGQDIGLLGAECEALSPMVYPSHYSTGYRGWAEPGNHPEIVGIGTKGAIEQLRNAKVNGTIIRSWLQAFSWKTPDYGPKYLVEEARQAEAAGGVGWLMWSPACEYSAAWRGFPAIKK